MAGTFGGYIGAAPTIIVPSGAIANAQLGSGAVSSGDVASGQIGNFAIASGQVLGLLGVASGTASVSSGTFTGFELGSGAIVSGRIASGHIGTFHYSSGAVAPGASYVAPFVSGGIFSLTTQEVISGVKAVAISQSGTLWIAMAAVSGRMPAVGVVVDNVANGAPANVYVHGAFQVNANVANFSGLLGQPLWVGRSGQVQTISGGVNSGGYASGDIGQKMGVALNSGAILVNANTTVWSGGPLGEATGGVI